MRCRAAHVNLWAGPTTLLPLRVAGFGHNLHSVAVAEALAEASAYGQNRVRESEANALSEIDFRQGGGSDLHHLTSASVSGGDSVTLDQQGGLLGDMWTTDMEADVDYVGSSSIVNI